MGRLEKKIAVVSGATGGIGRATCRRFCEEGASVYGLDISDGAGFEMQKEFSAIGFNFNYLRCDVASFESVKSASISIASKNSAVDILVNSAGIILGKPLLETTEEEWDHIQNVNLKSVFLMMKEFAQLMKQKGGSIINVSSIGGVVAFGDMSAYGAAKAGVVMLSKVGAVDFAPGIRVNAVCPGIIDTPMPHSFLKDSPEKDAIMKYFADSSLTGRLGKPEEIAALFVYLASDESAFVTGSAISIDGGWSVR